MGEAMVIPYSILCCATFEGVTICMSHSFGNVPLVGLLLFRVGQPSGMFWLTTQQSDSHLSSVGPGPAPIKVNWDLSLNFSGSRIRPTAQTKHAVLQRNIFLIFLGQDLTLRVLRWITLKLKSPRLILTEVINCPAFMVYVWEQLWGCCCSLMLGWECQGCVLCADRLLPVVLLNMADAEAPGLLFLQFFPWDHSHLQEVCVEQGSQLELWL